MRDDLVNLPAERPLVIDGAAPELRQPTRNKRDTLFWLALGADAVIMVAAFQVAWWLPLLLFMPVSSIRWALRDDREKKEAARKLYERSRIIDAEPLPKPAPLWAKVCCGLMLAMFVVAFISVLLHG